MDFKIDTKEKIVVVTPELKELDANLSDDFIETLTSLQSLEGRNLILDMSLVQTADDIGVKAILTVYHAQYDSGRSCAITGLNSTLTKTLTTADDSVQNVVPTLLEAIDMVMMEELERELLEGEE
jgi:anti-anti-sigma regulatory factor